MTKRQIGSIAAAFALLVQAAFVLTYRSVIYGCCGGLNQAPQPPIALPHVLRFTEAAAQPLALLTDGPGKFATFAQVFGGNGDPAALTSVVPFALINATIWFVAVYLLLNGVVLLCRIRIAGNALGDGPRRSMIHLSPAGQVRPAAFAAGALVLMGLVLGSAALHRRWWLSEAKQVMHASVAATRTGGGDPPGVKLSLSGTPRALAPSNFRGSYVRRVQPRTVGTHPLDVFAAPVLVIGEIQFATGFRYEFSVQRLPNGWKVSLDVPCRGNRNASPRSSVEVFVLTQRAPASPSRRALAAHPPAAAPPPSRRTCKV